MFSSSYRASTGNAYSLYVPLSTLETIVFVFPLALATRFSA